MKKLLLLGDQAIAQAALDAGISGVYAYPGTPSTEITEYIQQTTNPQEIFSRWCVNEKTAMEAALGASYVGKRALVCMKHVGMNVAADAFVNAAMTGANGGLVVVAADDPSMHSSQNEQDSRFYGKFALVPILEPASQQEAYDITIEAFELSEKFRIPVLLRLTTRLAHSRAVVNRLSVPRPQNIIAMPLKTDSWVLMPHNARRRYLELIEDFGKFTQAAENSPFNKLILSSENSKKAIIACGIAYNYLCENFATLPCSVLKISQYPIPEKLISQLIESCDEVLVMEEGQPMVEEQLCSIIGTRIKVHGRLDGWLPRVGELNADNVKSALGIEVKSGFSKSENIVARPPALCKGCGHRDLYDALNAVVSEHYPAARIFSDIGCYTLGALPPYRAVHTCVDMGASITMAKGASDMGFHPAIAVIGDSTFTHSGMTGLLDAVNSNSNITIIISDNLTTAMTGGQDSAGTNKLEDICRAIGVNSNHIRTFVPMAKNMNEMKAILLQEIQHPGVSVVIPRRECIQTLKRNLKTKKA